MNVMAVIQNNILEQSCGLHALHSGKSQQAFDKIECGPIPLFYYRLLGGLTSSIFGRIYMMEVHLPGV